MYSNKLRGAALAPAAVALPQLGAGASNAIMITGVLMLAVLGFTSLLAMRKHN